MVYIDNEFTEFLIFGRAAVKAQMNNYMPQETTDVINHPIQR